MADASISMVVTERKAEGDVLGALLGLDDLGSVGSSSILIVGVELGAPADTGEAVLDDLDTLADLEATGGLVAFVDLESFLADLATLAEVGSAKMVPAAAVKMMGENFMVC